MNRRPDLIVPIRDRRQHKRYLTLKNVAVVGGVLLAGFLIVTIYGEMTGLQPGEHGRIFRNELPEPPAAAPPAEVVREEAAAVVPDADSADPTLMEPMTRAQWLEAQPEEPATTVAAITAPTLRAPVQGDARIAIVGGAEGISVVKESRKRPVLTGGFGR